MRLSHPVLARSSRLLTVLLAAAPLALGACDRDDRPGHGPGHGEERSDEVKQGLSSGQRRAIARLQQRRRAGEITNDQYHALRRQIRPRVQVEQSLARVAEQRAALDLEIAANGYDGHEDCLPVPDGMLIPEVVAQTPIDPVDRQRLRADTRGQDAEASVAVQEYLRTSGADPSTSATVAASDLDLWGGYHARLRQTYQGVPLTKGSLFVSRADDGTFAVDDFTIAGIDLDPVPSVPSSSAEAAALDAVDPGRGSGYLATAVLRVDPTLEPVLADPRDPTSWEWRLADAKLVYHVLVAPDYSDFNTGFDAILAASPVTFDGPGDPDDRDANTVLGGRDADDPSDRTPWVYPTATPYRVTVDAHTGGIVGMESLLSEDLDDFMAPPTIGLGLGYFNSFVDLNTTYYQPFDAYVLADFTRSKAGTANIVLHGKNLDGHDTADFELFLDDNNVWGNGLVNFADPACLACTVTQTPAVDVAFGVQRTYDFLWNVLGRWGTDDEGLSQTAVAHWDFEYGDAHYNGSSGLIAFGNGADASGPGNYSLGTVAHEIGHAIWKEEDVGTSSNQSKGMNEGHGDVLGGLVDIYQDNAGGQGSWLYRIPWAGGSWRGRTLDPEGYDECETSNDIEMCGVGSRYWTVLGEMSFLEHIVGIPFTRAFMHLAEGSSTDPDSGYYTQFFPDLPMRGIGLNKAAAIWMHMVDYHLPSSPNLSEARFGAREAAEHLFGVGSDEAKATANAFAAVGNGAKPADARPPEITVANVSSINPRTLTARVYGVANDDTGFELVEPVKMARKNDAFLGYIDLSEFDVGYDTVTFRAVDSEGKEDTVTRVCWLPYRPQLLENGGFEESNEGWSAANRVESAGGSLFGDHYLDVRSTPTVQTVDLAGVNDPELSYWVAANKGLTLFDQMSVRVLSPGGNTLATLALHDLGTDWIPRPPRSNGYLNFRHDLGAWEGQEIQIAFAATRSGTFRVDHAVVSYGSVELLPPGIQVFETDNSVFLTVLGEDFAAFDAMDLEPRIYVDGVEAEGLANLPNGAGVTLPLAIDALGGGAHTAQTAAFNEDGAEIAVGNHEWFAPKPVNELLTNGRFEAGLAGWTPAGAGVSVEDANGGFVFQGDHAARLGGQGSANEASIAQSVFVPSNIKSLKFTVRARREYSGLDGDQLVVDFLNQEGEILESALLQDTAGFKADHEPPHNFQTHLLLAHAPSTAALSGKTITVRLRVIEDETKATSFVVDNASLSYVNWGLTLGL